MGLLGTLGSIGTAVATGGASLLPKAFKQDPEEDKGTGEFHYEDGSKKYWKDPALAATLPPVTSDVQTTTVAKPELAPAVQVVDAHQAAKDAAAKLATGGKQTVAEGIAQAKAAQKAADDATATPYQTAVAGLAGQKKADKTPEPAAPKVDEDFSEREAIEKADAEELAARAPMHDLEEAPDESPEAEKLDWKKPPALDEKVTDQTKTSYAANNMPSSQQDIRKSVARVLGNSATPEAVDLVTRQAFHESNKGQNSPAYNLFGVKAKPGEPYVTATTTEIIDGKPHRVQAKFKAYASLDESIADHNKLIQKFYPKAWDAAQKGDTSGFVAGLTSGGKSGKLAYFTDDPATYQRALEAASTGQDVNSSEAVNVSRAPTPEPNMSVDPGTPSPSPVLESRQPPGASPQATGGASGASTPNQAMLSAVQGATPQGRAVGSIGSMGALASAGQAGPAGQYNLPPPNAEGLVLQQKQQTGGVAGASAGLNDQQRGQALDANQAAYNQQAMAIRENTIRQAEQVQQHADEYRKDMMARTKAATDQKSVEDGWGKSVDEKMVALSNQKINPDKLYDDMGTFGSVLAHIGMFLGGAVSAITHGPNYVMQYFEQAKQDNIKAQVENKNSAYQDLVRQYGDHKAATAALSLKMDQGFEDKLKANLADEKSTEVLARGRELLAANEINKNKSTQELRDALYGKEVKNYQEQLERPKAKDPLLADDLLKQTLAVRNLTTLQQTSEGGNTPLTHDEYAKEVEDYSKKTAAMDDFGNSIKRVAGRLGLTITTDKSGRQVISGKPPDVSLLPSDQKALLDSDWSRITRADVMGMPREPSQELQGAFVKSTERPFWDSRIVPQLQDLLDIQNQTQGLVDSDFHPLVVERHRAKANLPMQTDALGNPDASAATPSLRLRGSSHRTVDAMGNASDG
jgi:flagellum-specific peptidoglycan hydrolase FlgJ